MKIHFENTISADSLYPFAAVRPIEEIRIGILTISEKWKLIANLIENKHGAIQKEITVPSNILPSFDYAEKLILTGVSMADRARPVDHPWDIFILNDWAIREDFALLTMNRTSQPIPLTNRVIASENIFIEEGAVVEHCIINASEGPIYIGKNALMMEGSMIRGPFALCENAVLKMGTKIYGATTVGPDCIVAGEIKNSVFFGYSNKAHDGYLGDSVIGEWCNLGAGTTNSNIKNSGGVVMVWNQALKQHTNVGTKCGLLMGDYSRAAINTAFNTGTVVGVSCNIFGEGFPERYIPDFAWGTWGKQKYILDKALRDIDNWMKLKGKSLSGEKIKILNNLYKN